MDFQFDIHTQRRKHTKLVVGYNISAQIESVLKTYSAHKAFVVIDENVRKSHPFIIELIQSVFAETLIAEVPSGEQSKSIKEWSRLIDVALQARLRRNTPLIAIGGGVTGDLAGFVAASVLRGLPLIHIPTTLLAMVDSSIGGKTGINHTTGKNLIGSFYQADHILMDTRFLSTLPRKEWNCGMGEVIKYACISDPSIFDVVETTLLNLSEAGAVELVAACAKIKSDIVMEDELESGKRSFLNYGHTFAHALEAFTQYAKFAHGEAVYVGLIAATWFSVKKGAPVDANRICAFAPTFGLKTKEFIPHTDALVDLMFNDKKITGSSLRLILLNDWAKPVITEIEDLDLVREAWAFALKTADT